MAVRSNLNTKQGIPLIAGGYAQRVPSSHVHTGPGSMVKLDLDALKRHHATPIMALFGVMLVVAAGPSSLGSLEPKYFSVLAGAEVQRDPPAILLSWPADTNATFYAISKRTMVDRSWTPLWTGAGDATHFADSSVLPYEIYEYQLVKTTAQEKGYGYLRSAVEAPLVDDRGKIILVITDQCASELPSELAQLERDLIGDGWVVSRQVVSPDQSVSSVKALIKAEYDADPSLVRAVFLFGHVPVPYSGMVAPDGHPNHRGAWPADVYYADMHGQWTDVSVTSTNAERTRNWNLPGDGKFDQDTPPGGVHLQIGRVDLSNLTCFANKTPSRSEIDLLRQYLAKDHAFRHGRLVVERRGLICDNFSDKGRDPIAGSGWRNFAGFFGARGIFEVGWSNYFPAVANRSYLWTFASGGGQYYTCTGVGSSDDFALQDPRAVFTLWLGSYFGDWDNESNFLRAALGSSTYTLTSSYSGFPQWLYHPMALGETIGYCAKLTQNNPTNSLYPPFNPGAGQIHVALHGDPTLRMHPVLPPSVLSATVTPTGVQLAWMASPDSALRGYHVYRASSSKGPFLRLTGGTPIQETSYTDMPPGGSLTYMVRAVKLERSSSGTYLNPSQGVFAVVDRTSIQIARSESGKVKVSISGPSGEAFVMEDSGDLVRWQATLTNVLSEAGFNAVESLDRNSPARFYRARTPGRK